MHFTLWFFLSITVVSGLLFATFIIYTNHKHKVKQLEIETLKIKQVNIEAEVQAAVERSLKKVLGRIEVLEAIVTDKSYELNEKISRLK